MNKLFLAGMVTGKNKSSVTMETTETTATGDYTETHEVMAPAKLSKEVEVGNRYKVTGQLARTEDNITVIVADKFEQHPDSELDLNACRITGKAHRSFEFYPRTDSQAAFGNLLVSNEENPQLIVRGVAFQHLGHALDREAKRGSTVQIQGRIRHRPYEAQGEKRKMLEIICDPDFTKVLEKAVVVDLFAEEAPAEPEAAAI